jgi:PIN domain nuclease of toxin-antitoxin system
LRLLLDTHIAIWAALDPTKLSQAERRYLQEAESPPVLSAVAVWEARLKWHSLHISGARKGPIAPSAIVGFAAAIGWAFLPLTPQHAATELLAPLDHKDPFDELLLVQAQADGLRLLTRDLRLAGHPFVAPAGRD